VTNLDTSLQSTKIIGY